MPRPATRAVTRWTKLPDALGERLIGSFDGTLTSIYVSPSRTKHAVVVFDVIRTE